MSQIQRNKSKKVFVGKIGQPLNFNRNAAQVRRSNMNGNVDNFKFYTFLFDASNKLNWDVEFDIIGDTDLNKSLYKKVWPNVKAVKKPTDDYDLGIVYGGSYLRGQLLDFLKEYDGDWILVSTDTRTMLTEVKDLKRPPIAVFTMTDNKSCEVYYNMKWTPVNYLPLQELLAYNEGLRKVNVNSLKTQDLVISISESKDYNRVKVLYDLIGYTLPCKIFGRIDETGLDHDYRYFGELETNSFYNIFAKAKQTVIVPVKPKWVSGKYVESILLGVAPIFVEGYNIELMGLKREDVFLVRNSEEFLVAYEKLKNEARRKQYVESLRKKLNLDGMITGDKFINDENFKKLFSYIV